MFLCIFNKNEKIINLIDFIIVFGKFESFFGKIESLILDKINQMESGRTFLWLQIFRFKYTLFYTFSSILTYAYSYSYLFTYMYKKYWKFQDNFFKNRYVYIHSASAQKTNLSWILFLITMSWFQYPLWVLF